MNIGKKIKDLRQENNLTQEELANDLGVSFQAVSRWENGMSYPDIEILPILANMFDITVDDLLEVDVHKKEKEIKKIMENDLILSNKGKTKERESLLVDALKKYPNSWQIKNLLMDVYFTFSINYDKEEYVIKTIKLAEDILEKCVEDEIRYSAIQTLIYIYLKKRELDKAKQIVNRLPVMYVTEDWFWPDVVKGEERIKATQHIFVQLVDMFYLKLVTTFGRAEVGKRDIPLLKYKELLDIVYENGDYGFYYIRLHDIYLWCAKDQAQIKDKNKTIEYLLKAKKCLNIWLDIYKNKEGIKHTSFLVDRLIDDPTKWTFSHNPINYKNDFINDLKLEIFDFIREDEEFNNILNG